MSLKREWMREEQGLKQCSACQVWKPTPSFSLGGTRLDGYQGWCKACTSSYKGGQSPEAPKGWSRENVFHLRSRFAMTPGDYLGMLYAQGGRCSNCFSVAQKGQRLSVDHNHTCCPGRRVTCGGQCIRSLLCDSCNKAEGHLREVVERGGHDAAMRLVELAES